MSHDRNIVRDRTLVLRVLVPGLHTRLNDKINSIHEGGDSNSTTGGGFGSRAGGMSGRSSGGGGNAGGSSKSADSLINLDGVTCLPSSSGSTLWHFRCDGATYPARLVNLPCPVEVHKTHDHATYHKSADVGQMLIVYEDEYAMEEAENEKGYKIDGFPSYYHSGLSPPMRKVVRRRFLSRFEERDTKPVPPQKNEVSEVEKEIQDLIAKLIAEKGKGKGRKGAPPPSSASSVTKEKVIEEIEEEVVDFEPWMGENGGVFTFEDAKMHPEWWLSKDEIKEIEEAKKAAEKEKKEREEREAAEAAAEAERKAAEEAARRAAEPPPSSSNAEEGKKKKKKKKKKKQEADMETDDDLLDLLSDGGKKKGIASLKSREEEQIDEVTQAAMTISQGIDNEELLLEDDMFDFDNEDITDLF